MTRKPRAKIPRYAISDEAAAYIADALMELALQFESSHFAQIRRHYQSTTSSVDDRIIAILAASQDPLPFTELRGQCRARSVTVYECLAALTATGRVSKSPQGYRLADGGGVNGHGPDKA